MVSCLIQGDMNCMYDEVEALQCYVSRHTENHEVALLKWIEANPETGNFDMPPTFRVVEVRYDEYIGHVKVVKRDIFDNQHDAAMAFSLRLDEEVESWDGSSVPKWLPKGSEEVKMIREMQRQAREIEEDEQKYLRQREYDIIRDLGGRIF